MRRSRWVSIFLVGQILLSTPMAFCQTERSARRSAATLIFSTLAGSVLGLSTLSFYDKPEEHTANINLGAILGLIGGSAYIIREAPRRGEYSSGLELPRYNMANNQALNKSTLTISFELEF